VDRFSKFFHQLIQKKILHVGLHICTMLLHYLVKFENPKNYRMFTLNVRVNMFN